MYLAIPGFTEMWPILAVVLVFFGAKKLPGLARAVGSSVTQFKKGLQDDSKTEELPEGSSDDDPSSNEGAA
jgi:sec-independent protein translocase protein TatA